MVTVETLIKKNPQRRLQQVNRQVKVNVIMRKVCWVVRVSTPDNGLAVFAIEPSAKVLRERLNADFPDSFFRIDYTGLFQVI